MTKELYNSKRIYFPLKKFYKTIYTRRVSKHGKLSKETELEAIKLLQSRLQGTALVRDLSDSEHYDFEILYEDGRRAIGEIGLLANTKYESAWASLRKREHHHIFELPINYGTWATNLYDSPSIKNFEKNIAEIISELNRYGVEHFQVGMHPELRELSIKCERIGIQYLFKHHSDSNNRVVYFLDMGHSFLVDPTLDSLVKDLEAEILRGQFQDSWKKLLLYHAHEKHIVLKCGSQIPLNHQHALLKTESMPQIPDITFPQEITHI